MRPRPTTDRLRIAILLGLLLVLGAAASASAMSAALPGTAASAHGGAAVSLLLGERRNLTIAVAALNPGDVVRERVVVGNGEAFVLRYALTISSTDPDGKGLRGILRLAIRTADRGSGASATCDRFDGQSLYDGLLGAETAGVGDASMGGQPGDRLLAPGATEAICVEISTPLFAGNQYQGATTSTTWTIAAEQEAGNP